MEYLNGKKIRKKLRERDYKFIAGNIDKIFIIDLLSKDGDGRNSLHIFCEFFGGETDVNSEAYALEVFGLFLLKASKRFKNSLINAVDNAGMSALMHAFYHSANPTLVKYLVSIGSNLPTDDELRPLVRRIEKRNFYLPIGDPPGDDSLNRCESFCRCFKEMFGRRIRNWDLFNDLARIRASKSPFPYKSYDD